MVDVAVRHEHRVDRRVAQALPRVQTGVVDDLLADVRRGVHQEPAFPVGGDGEARLGARPDPRIARRARVQTGQRQFHWGSRRRPPNRE